MLQIPVAGYNFDLRTDIQNTMMPLIHNNAVKQNESCRVLTSLVFNIRRRFCHNRSLSLWSLPIENRFCFCKPYKKISGIKCFAECTEQFGALIGFLDKAQPVFNDEIGLDGIFAIAAAEQEFHLGRNGLDVFHDMLSAEYGHDHIEKGEVNLAGMTVE
jgi:hypothetical protein